MFIKVHIKTNNKKAFTVNVDNIKYYFESDYGTKIEMKDRDHLYVAETVNQLDEMLGAVV